MAIAMPDIDTMNISQLEYLAEGYRYSIRTEIDGAKITICLRKLDEHEDMLIVSAMTAPIGADFNKVFRSTLREAVEQMIAYEHRKDDE